MPWISTSNFTPLYSACTTFDATDFSLFELAFEPLEPRSCPNCGAPVKGLECKYCGTAFSRKTKEAFDV